MTVSVTPKLSDLQFSPIATGGIQKQLELSGRLPPVTLQISPLDKSINPFLLARFLSYTFSSSVLIPVDSFSFSFVAPDDPKPMNSFIKEGDLVTLLANGVTLSTGIIDQTDVETDNSSGERGSINGRNLLSQLEDQDAVSPVGDIIWASSTTIGGAVQKLLQSTRIPGLDSTRVPSEYASRSGLVFATEAGENKLTAIQRFLDPFQMLVWCAPTGQLIIGRPNMKADPSGLIICSKEKRKSNVLSIKCVRSSATIPNIVLPIWTGQESVQTKVKAEQVQYNSAKGPFTLRERGHFLTKTIPISIPQGADAQSLSEVNRFKVNPGTSTLIQSYGRREFAKANQKEVIVQAVVPGHYNENGLPYLVDSVYQVTYDRGDIDEKMYLFQAEYNLSESTGQTTSLYFCRLGTIVADVPT